MIRWCLAWLLVIFLPVLVLGALLPQPLIGTGTDGYRGDRREFAEYALARAKAGKGWDLVPLVWAGRVMKVRTLSTEGPCGYDTRIVGRYEAEVELYSLFGAPYGRASVGYGDAVATTYRDWVAWGAEMPNPVGGILFYALLFVRIAWPALALFVFSLMLVGGALLWRSNAALDRLLGSYPLRKRCWARPASSTGRLRSPRLRRGYLARSGSFYQSTMAARGRVRDRHL